MKYKWLTSCLAVVLSAMMLTSCMSFLGLSGGSGNSSGSKPASNQSAVDPNDVTDPNTGNPVTNTPTDPNANPNTDPANPNTEPTAEPTVAPTPTPSPDQAGVADQEPEALALAFIENSFSFHGKQLASDALDPESKAFAEVNAWRQELINERRALFGNDQALTDLTIEKKHVSVDGDRAFVMLRTLETYEYANEPGMPGVGRSVYTVLLRHVDSAWRVSWAGDGAGLFRLAQGAGQTEEEAPARDYFRYAGIYLPFVPAGTLESIDNLDLADYANDDIFAEVEAFPYADLAKIGAKEREYMREDQAALAKAAPIRPFSESSGLQAFDRTAMADYITTWALERNPEWGDFSPYGGDCQNFASQVMLTGGAPMADEWYFHSWDDRAPAWSGVPWMTTFITTNEGTGPHGEQVDSWTELDVGDMIHIDWTQDGNGDHATLVTTTGANARLSGHSGDALGQRVSDVMGHKINLHLLGYVG